MRTGKTELDPQAITFVRGLGYPRYFLDEVEKGEIVTITRHGRPVAVLAPVAPRKNR